MNGHLKKLFVLLMLSCSLSACATTTGGSVFDHADYSGGSAHYNVYVPSQGRSIMSALSF